MVVEQPSGFQDGCQFENDRLHGESINATNEQSAVGGIPAQESSSIGNNLLNAFTNETIPVESMPFQNNSISTIACGIGLGYTTIPCVIGSSSETNPCDLSSTLNCEISTIVDASFPQKCNDSDGISAYNDPYNSDYTDTVSSDDSNKFLLPPKECDKAEIVHEQSIQTDHRIVQETLASDTVVEVPACFDDKEYTNTVSSNTSSTRPLLTNIDSMWGLVKEFEVRTPVIGLIDHPGFMSSQRDISSTTNISFACQKALQYLNDERVASSLLLPGSFKDVSKSSCEEDIDPSVIDHNIVPSGRHTRNLIALSVCNLMVYIACGSLRNLQSSLNHEGGVGIISLAVSCLGFVIGSVFSPFFVQTYNPYRCLLASLLPQAIFIGANFYPVLWIMAPISFIQGLSSAVLWNAMSTYVTFLAKGFSEKRKQDYEQVLGKFFGIFCLMYQMHMIFGNLIASLILTYANPLGDISSNNTSFNASLPYQIKDAQSSLGDNFLYANVTSTNAFSINSTSKDDLLNSIDISYCGSNYCHHYTISNSTNAVSDFAKYILFGIYLGCLLLSVLIAWFLLEPLNKNLFASSVLTCSAVKSQVVSLGKFIINRKFLLLCPLLLFSSMEQGFATAEITKAYITCPIGVHMVGYSMICMGLSASASAYLSGHMNKLFGRSILFGIVP